jgi:hypothetical protein
MILTEVILNKKNKKNAILKNLGKQVIIKDKPQEWYQGILLENDPDNKFYKISLSDARGIKKLFYKDLKILLLFEKYNRYPI